MYCVESIDRQRRLTVKREGFPLSAFHKHHVTNALTALTSRNSPSALGSLVLSLSRLALSPLHAPGYPVLWVL